jgi:predicted SAM-dependent methyltransferase
MNSTPIKRLNWGCGNWRPEGWINSDLKDGPGIDITCDILKGLPLADDSLDYAVGIHSLPEMHFNDLVPALQELRRALKPGGVLRLALPDIDKGFDAYRRGDLSYFLVPDEDAKSIGAKFVTQMLWYGYSKLLFTRDFIEEKLRKAGFSEVRHCSFRQTQSRWPEIVELDNREKESLFVEATK